MKKGFICVLLSVLLLMPILSSCVKETEIEEVEAEIYTFYTIVDEATTPEALHEVELSLNRTIFYRLGAIVKLIAVTEDEYDKLVDDKIAEVEAFQLAKKNSNKSGNKKNTSASEESSESSEVSDNSDESAETSDISGDDNRVKTGEYWLDVLADGGEIELKEPRIDIFVARGYNRYYDLAYNGKLTALDEKLNNEAKALKSSIHSTLLTAVKVNNKTYGIPVNTAIGEYTYLVFDKELLEKYSIDQNTIASMEDLNNYLSIIHENEPGVVPLMNTVPSKSIGFLAQDGSPALVNSNGEVIPSYTNNAVRNYLAMIARYQSLGYLSSAEESGADARYAVRIESGSIEEIESRLSDTGYEYEYSLYSNPIATNENTVDNVICISATVNSSNLTKVSQIVTAIYTDPDLMDLLTYGVENLNYIRNDKGQIERLDDAKYTYIAKSENMGNSFITSTLAGEDPNKWATAIKQNQDAVVSPSLGFTFVPKTFTYTDKDGNEQVINEPDYIELIGAVVDEYYPKLMRGTAVDIDFEALHKQATDDITQEYADKLDALYKDNVLTPMFTERLRNNIIRTQGARIRKVIEEDVMDDVRSAAESELRRQLTKTLQEENPDADEAEIEVMVEEKLTDKYINDNLYIAYSKEEVEEMIQEKFDEEIDDAVYDELYDVLDSAEYEREFQRIKNSADYKADLEAMITYDAPAKIEQRYDTLISAELLTYTDEMIAKMNTVVEEAVTKFVADNKDLLELSEDEILYKIGAKKKVKASEAESADGESTETSETESAETSEDGEGEEEEVYVDAYESWYDFVFAEKLQKGYYDIFGKPSVG